MKKLNVKILLAAASVAAGLSAHSMIADAAVRAPAPAPVIVPVLVKPVSVLLRPAAILGKPAPLTLGTSLGVKSSGEVARAVPGLAVRPPYRPPPRSPYRPPARPPFGP